MAAAGDPADEPGVVAAELAEGLLPPPQAVSPIPVATTATSRADARRTFILSLPKVTDSDLSSPAATICDGNQPMSAT
jgi:hypothetical protein